MSPHRRQIDKENNIYQFRNNGNAELDTNNAQIGQSGNSDVDVYVNIEIDTKPIAYALLSSLLATKQITRFEKINKETKKAYSWITIFWSFEG